MGYSAGPHHNGDGTCIDLDFGWLLLTNSGNALRSDHEL